MGKKVKVRDMQLGWTYSVPGKTLEEIYESKHEYAKWPPVGMPDAIPNTGLLLHKVTEANKDNWDGMYGFKLYPIHEVDEITDKPLRPGQSGSWQVVRTGNKIWTYHPNYTVWVKVDSLDFEMEEAHPFPVAIVRDNYEPIPLPNPWTWQKAQSETASKSDNYVSVWDESDIKTLIVLGIISFIFLLAGPSGWSMIIMIWLFAMAYFRSKHNKIRREVLKEREKHGVRGDGLDHKFRW